LQPDRSDDGKDRLVIGNRIRYSWLIATLTIMSSRIDSTTEEFTELATPADPPRVDRPFSHETMPTMAP
jgi:hypothetical protein